MPEPKEHPLLSALRDLQPDEMSPKEALKKLYKLKMMLQHLKRTSFTLKNKIKKMADNFKVISGQHATASFINDVQKAADEHRNSLGFLPKSVYAEFARRGYLYVLVETSPKGCVYAGHLLFDCTFPRAKIVQMFSRSNVKWVRLELI